MRVCNIAIAVFFFSWAQLALSSESLTTFQELEAACKSSGTITVSKNINFTTFITIPANVAVTITTSNDESVIFDALFKTRHFFVSGRLSAQNILFKNGNANYGQVGGAGNLGAANNGGSIAINAGGNLSCVSCIFRSNIAYAGGALYVSGIALLHKVSLIDNRNFAFGGVTPGAAIYIDANGHVTTEMCTFASNYAGGWNYDWGNQCCTMGAAIYNFGGNFIDYGSIFKGNVIGQPCNAISHIGTLGGAAIYGTGISKISIIGTSFSGNICLCVSSCYSLNSTIYIDQSTTLKSENIQMLDDSILLSPSVSSTIGVEISIVAPAQATFIGTVPPANLISGSYKTYKNKTLYPVSVPSFAPGSPTPVPVTSPSFAPGSPTPVPVMSPSFDPGSPTPEPSSLISRPSMIGQPISLEPISTYPNKQAKKSPTLYPSGSNQTNMAPVSRKEPSSLFTISLTKSQLEEVLISQIIMWVGSIIISIIISINLFWNRIKIDYIFKFSFLNTFVVVLSTIFGFASNVLQIVSMVLQNNEYLKIIALFMFIALSCHMVIGTYLIRCVLSQKLSSTSLAPYLIKDQRHDMKSMYILVFLLMLMGSTNIVFLPWNSDANYNEFVIRSNGFPKFWVMRLTLYCQLIMALVFLISGIINIATNPNTNSETSLSVYMSLGSSVAHVLQSGISIAISILIENIRKFDNLNTFDICDGNTDGNNGSNKSEPSHDIQLTIVASTINNALHSNFQEALEPEIEKISSKEEENDFEIDERGFKFISNRKWADLTIDILQNQVLESGRRPLEFIPLSELRVEIATLEAAAYAGISYNEGRLEHLYACLNVNEEYKAEVAVETRKFREENMDFAVQCLDVMRGFIPPNIFCSSLHVLESEGIVKELAKRIMRKKCLWLLRLSKPDILRLHSADFTKGFTHEGQNLDIVETAALWAAMPERFSDNLKEAWRLSLENNLKTMRIQQKTGMLQPAKARNPAYKGAYPLYIARESMHEINVVSGANFDKPRDSFKQIVKADLLLSGGIFGGMQDSSCINNDLEEITISNASVIARDRSRSVKRSVFSEELNSIFAGRKNATGL